MPTRAKPGASESTPSTLRRNSTLGLGPRHVPSRSGRLASSAPVVSPRFELRRLSPSSPGSGHKAGPNHRLMHVLLKDRGGTVASLSIGSAIPVRSTYRRPLPGIAIAWLLLERRSVVEFGTSPVPADVSRDPASSLPDAERHAVAASRYAAAGPACRERPPDRQPPDSHSTAIRSVPILRAPPTGGTPSAGVRPSTKFHQPKLATAAGLLSGRIPGTARLLELRAHDASSSWSPAS